MIDIVDLISSTFKRNKKGKEAKILGVLEHMFHGGCRKTSKALGAAFEPKAKPTANGLARKVLKSSWPKREHRPMIAVDGTKLKVKGREAYVWAVVDVDTEELLAIDASYLRSGLDAHLSLDKVLGKCRNKPTILVGGGPWCPWALQRLGLQYVREGLGRGALLRGSSGI